MKKSVLEKLVVVTLFVSVIAAFALAERDTKKLFQKYNTKATVEVPAQKPDVTSKLVPAAAPAKKLLAD